MIKELSLIDGDLGSRAQCLVLDWATIHQDELRREWELAQARQPLFKIEPLE